jgi:hypothetical protein
VKISRRHSVAAGAACVALSLGAVGVAHAAPAAAPAPCHSTQLTAGHTLTEGAAGSVIVHIRLTDVGTTSCSLSGYVGAELFDDAGTPLPTTVTREGGERSTVVLAPGASATALLRYRDPGLVPGCHAVRSHSLLVTPPGRRLPLLVHSTAGLSPCGGALFTVPVRP